MNDEHDNRQDDDAIFEQFLAAAREAEGREPEPQPEDAPVNVPVQDAHQPYPASAATDAELAEVLAEQFFTATRNTKMDDDGKYVVKASRRYVIGDEAGDLAIIIEGQPDGKLGMVIGGGGRTTQYVFSEQLARMLVKAMSMALAAGQQDEGTIRRSGQSLVSVLNVDSLSGLIS